MKEEIKEKLKKSGLKLEGKREIETGAICFDLGYHLAQKNILGLLEKAVRKDVWGYDIVEADWEGLKKEISKEGEEAK